MPLLERPTLHMAVAITSLPIIALGPIFQVTLEGDAPRSALAGLAVFFTTLVGTIVGLRACDRSSVDLIRALGGGRLAVLRRVRVRAALPDYFAALKISAPAAVLGAIIGEFIGGSENGLGVALIAARANADSARVWGVALVATAVAGLGLRPDRPRRPPAHAVGAVRPAQGCGVSAVIDLTERGDADRRRRRRRAAPAPADRCGPAARSRRRVAWGVLRSLGTFVLVAALLLGLWVGFLEVFDVNSYVGKTPSQVWDWVTDPVSGAERRDELWEATKETLVEAGLGFLTGLAAAVVVAVAFVLSRPLERAVMPIALALRSVPIVAMVPLLAYIFGRELVGSLVIVSIIVWFPALVLVSNGLRSVRPEALDLLRAYDAGPVHPAGEGAPAVGHPQPGGVGQGVRAAGDPRVAAQRLAVDGDRAGRADVAVDDHRRVLQAVGGGRDRDRRVGAVRRGGHRTRAGDAGPLGARARHPMTTRVERGAEAGFLSPAPAPAATSGASAGPPDPTAATIPATLDNTAACLAAAWHPVAAADEVGDQPVGVLLLDRAWVLVRLGGEVRAFEDRCPHRLAPLSAGSVAGGRLVCRYHGWAFDDGGACTLIPANGDGGPVPSRACLARPAGVVERYGLVWLAPDGARLRPARLPRVGRPGVRAGRDRPPAHAGGCAAARRQLPRRRPLPDRAHPDVRHARGGLRQPARGRAPGLGGAHDLPRPLPQPRRSPGRRG